MEDVNSGAARNIYIKLINDEAKQSFEISDCWDFKILYGDGFFKLRMKGMDGSGSAYSDWWHCIHNYK